jgi:nucleoside-diphosphate-sugar epimerase
MKVLVTGASGFIGLALTQYLSSSTEIQVIGMVRSKTHGLENSNIEFRQ